MARRMEERALPSQRPSSRLAPRLEETWAAWEGKDEAEKPECDVERCLCAGGVTALGAAIEGLRGDGARPGSGALLPIHWCGSDH